jgi:hypothetical protein
VSVVGVTVGEGKSYVGMLATVNSAGSNPFGNQFNDSRSSALGLAPELLIVCKPSAGTFHPLLDDL